MFSLLALAGALSISRGDEAAPLSFHADGVFDVIPASMLMNVADMTLERPDWITVEATYENAPWYGVLEFGDAGGRMAFALDESDDGAVLYADLNANGDLTDDTPPTGERQITPEERRTPQLKIWIYDFFPLSIPVTYADGQQLELAVTIRTYGKVCRDLYTSMEPDLVYWSTYYRAGPVMLGDSAYQVAVKDQNADGRFDTLKDDTHPRGDLIFIDTDRDGAFNPRTEGFGLDAPFEVEGSAWEVARLSASGDSVLIVRSQREVVPSTLRVGQVAPDFEIPGVGRLSSLRGEVVLIDFWATWCVPCLAEMPAVIRIHDAYGDRGLRVVGVSIDALEHADRVHEVAADKGMTWAEVHDHQGTIARQYLVSAIPATFLIGPDGRILGTHLRGDALEAAVGRATGELRAP